MKCSVKHNLPVKCFYSFVAVVFSSLPIFKLHMQFLFFCTVGAGQNSAKLASQAAKPFFLQN
jgi:hypothetical protein